MVHHIISQPNVDWNILLTLYRADRHNTTHQSSPNSRHFLTCTENRNGCHDNQQFWLNSVLANPAHCWERKWKSSGVLCFPSAQILLVRILEMQSNLPGLHKNRIQWYWAPHYGDKNKPGMRINIQCIYNKGIHLGRWTLFKNIIGDKYFLRWQRSLSDYVPPLIDHDLLIDKEQFGC